MNKRAKTTAEESMNATSLKGGNLVSIQQLSITELEHLIQHSIDLKQSWKSDPSRSRSIQPLLGQSMSMIFQKRSTRTRVSTETGVHMLGGHALMLGPQDIQLGVNETLRDTGNYLRIRCIFFF